MNECSNRLCSYNRKGYCYNDDEIYYECEDQFWTADDYDYEDYAFSNYDCEEGLFFE